MMTSEISGRTEESRIALVTGGGRGIGRAISARLVRDGFHVVIADIDLDAAVHAAAAFPGRATGVRCDVTNRTEVEREFAALAKLGQLTLVVHNVGVSREVPFESMSDEDWNFQVDATLGSAFIVSQQAIRSFDGSSGCIVLVGSVNGIAAFGNEAYSAAKAGLASLAQNLTLRFGPQGVRTNVVAPGTIHTEFWDSLDHANGDPLAKVARHYPLGRIGQPEDIAAAVSFLGSDDASWISGIVLPFDGGLLAGNPGFVRDRETNPKAAN